jgi:siroheme synthase (precorrin-2 oxidase/ferrochelatase)
VTRRRDRRSAAPEPLGSVSHPLGGNTLGTEACLGCGSTDLVRIRMGPQGGRPVVFVSCRACERTAWFAEDGDGTPLGPDEVAGFTTGA